jgi:hypothetical protein
MVFFYTRNSLKERSRMMTTLYQLEEFDISKNLHEMEKYLQNEACSQQLHEIEHSLFKRLLELGKCLITQFLKNKSAENTAPFINKDDLTIPLHSLKKRNYLSIFGDIEIYRPYYWKTGCKGIFPMDAELNMPKHHHSYLLDKWIQRRVTEEPYEEAIKSICDLLDQKVSKRLTQQITIQASKNIDKYYQQKQDFPNEGSHLVVQADCKGVRMVPKERPETKLKEEFERRAKGVSKIGTKKNAVVTSDYSINPSRRTPKDVLEGLMAINSNRKTNKIKGRKKKLSEVINKQVAGTMEGLEKAFENLGDRLKTRDSICKKPIYILIDGAAPLEKGLIREFEKRGWTSRIVASCLDIVHATEYLWDASTAMYGESSPQRALWVREALEKTLNSNIRLIIIELEKKLKIKGQSKFVIKRLERSIRYFKNHEHMMDYRKYLELGFPIASGVIEGACNNLVKDRTERSGMQWTKKGAEAVIKLRSVQCNKDWESYWGYYTEKQSEDLYANLAA